MIVFGIRKFGRCDDLDGDVHVATKFFHIWFIPLIPTESFLVLSEEGNGFRGVKLPMSGKSVLAAYFRTSMVALAIGGIALFPFDLILTAGAIASFIFSYKWFKPSDARRAELLAMLGSRESRSALGGNAQPAPATAAPVVREPPPPGPNLVLMPNFDPNALRAMIERSGAQSVAAPPGAVSRWWSGSTAITLWMQQGSPSVLVFEGHDAEPWKQTVASTFGHVGVADAARMLQSNDPSEARFALAVAGIYRDGRLRPSVDRLRMHPDAWVRADAERIVQQMV